MKPIPPLKWALPGRLRMLVPERANLTLAPLADIFLTDT